MIDAEKRKAVYLLHENGMGVRELARRLGLSRGAVRDIIKEKGALKKIVRSDQTQVDPVLLSKLYADCDGYVERVHDKLQEEHNIEVGYSTLTRLVREMGLGGAPEARASLVPDEPGAEMQHDTSSYKLKLAGQITPVVGASLYLRYSKMRYVKFYPNFDRYRMKCFFYEALMHFGFCAPECIIDNTSLAILRGSGANAVMVPEMISFAKQYGFKWKAHAIKHSDRKGGVESGFWFIETNFFSGRSFLSFEDLNRQAFDWATQRIVLKPHAKSRLIPAQLFEFEKGYLQRLPPYVAPPVAEHFRDTDKYGYAAYDGNYFWVPGEGRGEVKCLRYPEKIRIIKSREVVAEYELPPWGVKNERIKPAGVPDIRPNNCKAPTGAEERRLKALGPEVEAYLAEIKNWPESSIKKYQVIRQLFRLSQKLHSDLFLKTIKRAMEYGVTDMETIERIAIYQLHDSSFTAEGVFDDPPESDLYPELDVSELPDLSKYDESGGDGQGT